MAITDELRAWAHGPDEGDDWLDRIDEFCDRIDAEHERVVRERRRSCVYYDPERHYCSCHDFDVSGYVELPKDADGVPIRVGDRLTDGEYTFTVCELATFRDGSWSIRNEDGNAWAACDVTHHALTVEDVLDEFFGKANLPDGTQTRAEIIAEYAARLRLVGDE